MLITLPSGRRIPVNYLREGDMVYAGADGRWWKELVGEGVPVEVLIQGETHVGRGRAVRDDPEYTARVFRRLRPNALDRPTSGSKAGRSTDGAPVGGPFG